MPRDRRLPHPLPGTVAGVKVRVRFEAHLSMPALHTAVRLHRTRNSAAAQKLIPTGVRSGTSGCTQFKCRTGCRPVLHFHLAGATRGMENYLEN